jgi:D,D-heptose 1,7-bisphosphate phosphatase
MPTNRAVFLDRDGTICDDVNYCSCADDFMLLPDVPEAVRLLNENGYKVIVITNQSGIARGLFTHEVLAEIHRKMDAELGRYDAKVDGVYYCPHHPDEDCECRKPKTGLLVQAVNDYDIEISSSFMVGDHQKDIDAGKALGCRTVLVTTGPDGGEAASDPGDYRAGGLLEAVTWILSQ